MLGKRLSTIDRPIQNKIWKILESQTIDAIVNSAK